MYQDFASFLRRPALWQRSSAPFWNDGHISKKMLEAHLNPHWDAASRKQETIDRSVRWLSTILPAKGKLLDLGCGPGLYTKRFSEVGYQVTGIDLSKRSIRYAEEHDSKTCYRLQNYLELNEEEAFDAVTLIYCDYAALTLPERKVLLEKVYQALRPGGLFLFDVFTDIAFQKKSETSSWSLQEHGGFWSEQPHLCLEATYLYENRTVSVDQCVIVSESGYKEYLIWDTAFTKERLADEVLPFGYQLYGVYDDVCGMPYTGKSETLCFVVMKPY